MPSEPRPGLRERKKVRTRSSILHHALRLIRRQGYESTTVSQIAEAAEVSESTFFRYFPTKEALFLEDDFDELLVEAYREQPAALGPIAAMRGAVRETFADITEDEIADTRERMAVVMAEPELRDAMAGHLLLTLNEISGMIARRSGKPAGDFGTRVLAGAVIGALMAGMMAAIEERPDRFVEYLDETFAALEKGFS